MVNSEQVIEQTKNWIRNVVVGCNFCPFADRVIKKQQVHYTVENGSGLQAFLETLLKELVRLDNDASIETSFIIFPNAVQKFEDYLDLVSLAEKLMKKNAYDGIYQLASFHPLYQFAGSDINDAANYTNRSIYPMLHILREERITNALARYPEPENIPERNIRFAREKGVEYMKMMRIKS